MKIMVQGKTHDHQGEPHVGDLLETLGKSKTHVNIRLNGEVLRRRDFDNIPLSEGDSVDFLYFMGGGR